MNSLKQIPQFKNEDEERDFWATHDVTEYFDMNKARVVSFPNLKPSTKPVNIRLPLGLLEDIKRIARQKDVPYQSFMKILLDRGLAEYTGKRSTS